jgi:hypothetical protein
LGDGLRADVAFAALKIEQHGQRQIGKVFVICGSALKTASVIDRVERVRNRTVKFVWPGLTAGDLYEIAAHASAAPGPGGAPLNMAIEVRQVMTSRRDELS